MTKVCFEDFITVLYLQFKSAIDTMCHKPAFIIFSPKNTHCLCVFSSRESLYIPCISTHSLAAHSIVLVWNVYKLPLSLTTEPLMITIQPVLIRVAKQSSVIRIESLIYILTQNVGLFPLSFSPITSRTLAGTFFSLFLKKWVLFKWIQM